MKDTDKYTSNHWRNKYNKWINFYNATIITSVVFACSLPLALLLEDASLTLTYWWAVATICLIECVTYSYFELKKYKSKITSRSDKLWD